MYSVNIATSLRMLQLGQRLAQQLQLGEVVYLQGQLGAGKTTLAKGILTGLGCQSSVTSPTYTLVQEYDTPSQRVVHLDLYRLQSADELAAIGLRDLLTEHNLILIEWPERGQGVLPAADTIVQIDYRRRGRRVTMTRPNQAKFPPLLQPSWWRAVGARFHWPRGQD